jgi:hypothetical protein
MKIDTKIRHVTKPGADLFLELGFPAEEARRLQAASIQKVDAALSRGKKTSDHRKREWV